MMDFIGWLAEAAYRNKKGCDYWGDAGAGVLPVAKTTGRILVNHRGQDVNEGGTYGVFGGGIFLDDTPYGTVEELARSNYPQEQAKQELKEESGYSGPIKMVELWVYRDNKRNQQGEPCNFFYWNFAGVVPHEFNLRAGSGHKWEEGGDSRWVTFTELQRIQPKHFGLQALLKNGGGKLLEIVHQLGFRGDESRPADNVEGE
jgi:hypothetical protein